MSLTAYQKRACATLLASIVVGQSPLKQIKSFLLRHLCFAALINQDCCQLNTFICLQGHAPTTTIQIASDQGLRLVANLFGPTVARNPVLCPCGTLAYHRVSITRQSDYNLLLRIAKEQTNILSQDCRAHLPW